MGARLAYPGGKRNPGDGPSVARLDRGRRACTLARLMKRVAWLILNVLFGALFLFSAMLQYNDPDPLPWMVLYIAAAIVSFLAVWRRSVWIAPALVGVGGASWLAVYFFHGAWRVEWSELFTQWQMKNQQVLEAREMLGLGIVVGWMFVLTLVAWRARGRGSAQ